jgi:hypothetical protein
MFIISLFTANSFFAGQTVGSIYYCDVLRLLRENVRRLRPELWLQKNWLLLHDNSPSHTSFFTREYLTKTKMTVVFHAPYFSLFTRLKGRSFDTIGVMQAESQAMLNTHTEYDLQDAFKNWQKLSELCIGSERDYFIEASRPKVSC